MADLTTEIKNSNTSPALVTKDAISQLPTNPSSGTNTVGTFPGDIGWTSVYSSGYAYAEAGTNVTPVTALQSTTVLSIVRRITSDMANMPIEIEKKIGKNDWVVDYDHYLNQIFERPNDRHTGHEFIEMLVLSYLVPGNGFAAIIFDKSNDPKKVGKVQELIPLLSGYTSVREEYDGKLKYRTNSKMLVNKKTQDPTRDGPTRWLSAEEIIHLKYLSIDGGITGSSPITMMVDTIGLDLAYQKMQSRLVKNGALFQFVLQLPGRPNDTQIINSQANLKRQIGGLENAGAPPVVSNGAQIVKTSMTPTELGLNEALLANAVKIAQGFGIPGTVVGFDKEGGGGAYEIEMKSYVDRTLMTIANALESAMEHKLLSKEERGKVRIRFNFDELLRASKKDRVSMGVSLITNGIITVNEFRLTEGLPEVEWGDVPRIPLNTGILGLDGNPIGTLNEDGSATPVSNSNTPNATSSNTDKKE